MEEKDIIGTDYNGRVSFQYGTDGNVKLYFHGDNDKCIRFEDSYETVTGFINALISEAAYMADNTDILDPVHGDSCDIFELVDNDYTDDIVYADVPEPETASDWYITGRLYAEKTGEHRYVVRLKMSQGTDYLCWETDPDSPSDMAGMLDAAVKAISAARK